MQFSRKRCETKPLLQVLTESAFVAVLRIGKKKIFFGRAPSPGWVGEHSARHAPVRLGGGVSRFECAGGISPVKSFLRYPSLGKKRKKCVIFQLFWRFWGRKRRVSRGDGCFFLSFGGFSGEKTDPNCTVYLDKIGPRSGFFLDIFLFRHVCHVSPFSSFGVIWRHLASF